MPYEYKKAKKGWKKNCVWYIVLRIEKLFGFVNEVYTDRQGCFA